jgi:MFS family permease
MASFRAANPSMSESTKPRGFQAFIEKFTVFRTAPRELWIIYIAYILENLAYKAGAAGVLTLWLSADLGYADESAGVMVAVWSAIMTLITVLVGSLTDALGIRKTFLLGFWVCLVSRIVMTVTASKWVALIGGLYLQAVGLALLVPVMIAGCKRYSNAAQRSVAFSLYYALMNLGFAAGDFIFDHVRAAATRHNGGVEHVPHVWSLDWSSFENCPSQMLMLVAVVFTVPGLILVWLAMREGVEMTEQGVKIHPPKPNPHAAAGAMVALWRSSVATGQETVRIFSGLWKQPAFYRFLLFMALVVGVKMIFYHLNYTFPKFAIRELGDGAPFAQISGAMNSLMILVLVPICGALSQNISAYRMVSVGSLISALSVFFLAMPAAWFQPMADSWLGGFVGNTLLGLKGAVNPLWISIFFFVVLLSVGEAFWSPRLYEYSAAIAPKGQEASYMALSLLPYFVAKFTVGLSSGWLLKWYCPDNGVPNGVHREGSGTMWLIIGLMALVTPVGTFLFRKHLQLQESGREPVISKAEAAAEDEEKGHG